MLFWKRRTNPGSMGSLRAEIVVAQVLMGLSYGTITLCIAFLMSVAVNMVRHYAEVGTWRGRLIGGTLCGG